MPAIKPEDSIFGTISLYEMRANLSAHDKLIASKEVPDKRKLYRTARATISCALFEAGEFVSVEYHSTRDGVDWYMVSKPSGSTFYPRHHLTDFVL